MQVGRSVGRSTLLPSPSALLFYFHVITTHALLSRRRNVHTCVHTGTTHNRTSLDPNIFDTRSCLAAFKGHVKSCTFCVCPAICPCVRVRASANNWAFPLPTYESVCVCVCRIYLFNCSSGSPRPTVSHLWNVEFWANQGVFFFFMFEWNLTWKTCVPFEWRFTIIDRLNKKEDFLCATFP